MLKELHSEEDYKGDCNTAEQCTVKHNLRVKLRRYIILECKRCSVP